MPGGSEAAWPAIKPIFQAIAAKVGPKADIPCCEWVGPRGAGHYVKMVHNGIEYGDMQLICEAYNVLKQALNLSNEELYGVFDNWNRGELDSYLIEITRDIFSARDPESGQYLVDLIKDTAGAKGTGKWMSQLALDLGVPSTLVTEAVYARSLSAMKDARVHASRVLSGPTTRFQGDRVEFIAAVRDALYASKICSYAQGFVQLAAAAQENAWPLNFGDIAMLWRGGCIIRARFLDRIKEAFDANAKLENLLLAPYFTAEVHRAASRLAARGGDRRRTGDLGAGVHHRPGLFRRLSPAAATGQFAASPARLLRRAHLRAARPAGRVSQRVDGAAEEDRGARGWGLGAGD